ncbi:unnamed protein product, partial [Hapterophycus canaliculatus]
PSSWTSARPRTMPSWSSTSTPRPPLRFICCRRRAGGGAAGNRAGPTLLRRRRQGVEYYVDHSGDAFYLVTNTNDPAGEGRAAMPSSETRAGEYQLVRVPQRRRRERRDRPRQGACAPSLEGIADAPWEEVPCGEGRGNVQEMDLFRDHCVLY